VFTPQIVGNLLVQIIDHLGDLGKREIEVQEFLHLGLGRSDTLR
jgi:hypothetical protein